MPLHPDPTKKLFGFRMDFASGQTDWGLIVATDKETARLGLESVCFSSICVTLIIDDQPGFVETILDQYRGIAFLTTESSCN